MSGFAGDDSPPACVACGRAEGLSLVPVRPHRVYVCTGCYAGLLRGPQVASGDAGRPFARAGGR